MNAKDYAELRLLYRALLDRYGIDKLELELLLVESCKKFEKGVKAGHNPAELRKELEAEQNTRVVEEEQDKAILDALESGLHITIRRDTSAAELAQYIRKSGKSVQRFLDWYRQDDFRMKNRAFLNCDKIKQMWPLAFENEPKPVQRRAPDPNEHLYVPAPEKP